MRGALASRPAPAPGARPKARPRPRAVPASRRRRRFRLGLAVIPLVAVLFAGVVWLNAAKLSVTKRQGQIVRQIAAVGDQIGQLKTVESQKNGVVAAWATRQGMVRPTSAQLSFVKARPAR